MARAGDIVVPAALYGAAWILMTTAMMLPSTLRLFAAFALLGWAALLVVSQVQSASPVKYPG